MASPRQVFHRYAQLGAEAESIRDMLATKGDKIPGTIGRLLARDAGILLREWGDEMYELAGVLDGRRQDAYAMESTQTFYLASLYAVVLGQTWEDLQFDQGRETVPATGITTAKDLRIAIDRMIAAGPEVTRPAELFLLWHVADAIYRRQTPADQQWSIQDLGEDRRRT